MNTLHTVSRKLCFLPLICLVTLALPTALADDAAPQATTVANAEIPVDELGLLLKPLTKDELVVEADGWLELLKAKVAEISRTRIEIKAKNRAIQESKEAAAEAAKAAKAAADAEAAAAAEAAKEAAETAQAADSAETVEQAADNAAEATDDATDEPTPATQEAEVAAEEAAAEVEEHAEVKVDLLERVNELQNERIALVDRFNAVLTELTAKGGDASGYETYITAVSGLQVDVSDTTALWTTIQGWLTSKEGGIRWGTNLVWAIVAIFIFWVAGRIAARATRKALQMSKTTSDLLTTFMSNLVRRLVVIAGVLVALSIMEVKLSPVLAIIGGAAFVVAFALQGTLSNFASGLLILAYRPFDIGDVIKAGGVFGTVKSMNLVSTHITTFDNQKIVVPNNSVWGSDITNVTGLPTRRVDMVFGIGYDDDIAKALKVLDEIVKAHPKVLKDPEPVIKLHELGDSSVNFVCRPWSKTADYWDVYWDVTRQVKERFDAEGISIPFPQRDVHLYQETK